MQVRSDGKSECRPVMGLDGDLNIIPRESGQTSIRFLFTRSFTELLKGGIANERESVCAVQQGFGLENN